jgi:hypothetical protein
MVSMPIIPSSRPKAAIDNVLRIEPPLMYARMKKPMTSSAVYSGGPKRSANAASVGASSMSPSTPSVPATKEPIAAIASAAPARPCCVIA